VRQQLISVIDDAAQSKRGASHGNTRSLTHVRFLTTIATQWIDATRHRWSSGRWVGPKRKTWHSSDSSTIATT